MKRLLIIMLVACSMWQVVWGQESSQSSAQSPFVGEWVGVFCRPVYWHGEYKNTKLILRIESFGDNFGVRVKEMSTDGQNVSYSTWDVVSASTTELNLIEKSEEHYSDEGFWFWMVYHYRLLYSDGRLQLIGYGADECQRSRGKVTSNYNPNIMRGFYDMYLYLNDNW